MKGVTDYRPDFIDRLIISIHTPVKGVTSAPILTGETSCYFNPHTREGCDLSAYGVSIVVCDFNPHTREGCDFFTCSNGFLGSSFQSTHP